MEYKKRIYIVEDQGITRMTIEMVLLQNNYEVIGSSPTAEKALIDLQERRADLVILDFNLKGSKNGLWLAHKLNEKLHIPFVFLTAYGNHDFLEKIMETNPIGYIMKPFNNPTLLTTVKIALQHTLTQIEEPKVEEACFIKTNLGRIKFTSHNLHFLQSDRNYVHLHTEDEVYKVRDKLENIFAELNFSCLYRVHRRYIVNSNFVTKLDNNGIFLNQQLVPISTSYQFEALSEACKNIN